MLLLCIKLQSPVRKSCTPRLKEREISGGDGGFRGYLHQSPNDIPNPRAVLTMSESKSTRL